MILSDQGYVLSDPTVTVTGPLTHSNSKKAHVLRFVFILLNFFLSFF
jgi:hypothetical protein